MIKPLEPYRQCLIWLCVHPADKSANNCKKITCVAFFVANSTFQLCNFIGCLTFCWKFHSIDLRKCLFAFLMTSADFGCIYVVMITITTMRHRIAAIFEDLSTIYDTHESEDSFCFLAQANNICNWIGSIYLKYTIRCAVSLSAICFISAVYSWSMNEHFNAGNCFHIYPIVYVRFLPWNQTTLLGYFGEAITIISGGAFYNFTTGVFLMLFVSMCIHHRAFHKMFKHSIDTVNQSDEKFLCGLIRFQISVKAWFLDTVNFYRPFVMVQLISCSGMLLAVSIFYLDLEFQHIDVNLVSVVIAFAIGMINALVYCYFGEMAIGSHEKMHDSVFDLKWYQLPIAIQKYLILMAGNMQRPLHYHGFGILDLNLKTFNQLMKSVYSYYMMIKTITT